MVAEHMLAFHQSKRYQTSKSDSAMISAQMSYTYAGSPCALQFGHILELHHLAPYFTKAARESRKYV
jgi:hypothetical protein